MNNLLQNFIIINKKSNTNIHSIENSFNLKSFFSIISSWNLKFFKLKNSSNLIFINKDNYILKYFSLKQLFLFLKLNENLFFNKLNLLHISYNGFFLNYNCILKYNYIYFNHIYFVYFLKLILSLIFNLFLILILKLINNLRCSFFIK